MELKNRISGTCWKCTEKEFGPDYSEKGAQCTRIFELKRGMVTSTSPTGTNVKDVTDVLCCTVCGTLVPLEFWRSYQATGNIRINVNKNKNRKGDRKW